MDGRYDDEEPSRRHFVEDGAPPQRSYENDDRYDDRRRDRQDAPPSRYNDDGPRRDRDDRYDNRYDNRRDTR